MSRVPIGVFVGLFASINTAKAGWLELRLAKWFGSRRIARDEHGVQITLVTWRGKTYLIDFQEGTDA